MCMCMCCSIQVFLLFHLFHVALILMIIVVFSCPFAMQVNGLPIIFYVVKFCVQNFPCLNYEHLYLDMCTKVLANSQ